MTKNQVQTIPSQKDITDLVMVRVNELKETGGLSIPKDYAIQNELKLAYFSLLETVDRNKRPALEVCSTASIANGLLKMVINGLSVAKSQGYFIVYGNTLNFTPSYFGNITIALRGGIVTGIPKAQVIYEGDEFQYEIIDGDVTILSHIQQFSNINVNKIIGAYAIVPTVNGDYVELMTMEQIRTSWSMGNAKGRSTAHSGFPDQMAKRTVINLALKYFNKTQDDAHLFLETSPQPSEEEPIEPEYVDIDDTEEPDNSEVENVEITDVDFEENPTEEEKPIVQEKTTPIKNIEDKKIKENNKTQKEESEDCPF